jgi:tetratricopeptide (TPR) repeat protein
VRCVVAAGWAVEDIPAEKFATAFYASLLRGQRFIEAVAAAREAAWRASPTGNTWAAYQCYGDPEWTWRRQTADAQKPAAQPGDDYDGIASPVGLALALENLGIGAEYSGSKGPAALEAVRSLDTRFGALWGEMGAVAEAFGYAYAKTGDIDKAIDRYRAAVNAGDGSASFKAAEQLGNQLVRRAERLSDASDKLADAAKRDSDLTQARSWIKEGTALLTQVVTLQPTIEREALLGSAYKRLVMVEGRAKDEAAALQALQQMVTHYDKAESIAREQHADNLYYPAKNGLSAELRLAFLEGGRAPRISAERMKEVQASLDAAAARKPDFWSVVGQTEMRVLEVLLQRRLAGSAPGLIETFRDHKARVPAVNNWDSVYKEAQFTLEPYQRIEGLPQAEARAAASLLEALKAFAEKN